MAEIFDVPSNEIPGEEKAFQTTKMGKSNKAQGRRSNTITLLPSDNDDESGDSDDDDDNDDGDYGDDNDDDDNVEIKNNDHASISSKHQHDERDDDDDDDDDDNEEDHRDKGDNDPNESPIGDHRPKWSLPLPQKRITGTLRNPKQTVISSTVHISQIQKNARFPTTVFANSSGTLSKASVKESQKPLVQEELNGYGNQVNISFQNSKKVLNLIHSRTFIRPPVTQSVSQSPMKDGNHRSPLFHSAKPIPPPVGFSSKPRLSESKLLSLLLNDTMVATERYNRTSICPHLELRKSRKWPENLRCIPRNHKLSLKSCLRATQEYELDDEPLKCGNGQPDGQMCSFKVNKQFKNQNVPPVVCNTSLCGTNPVYVLQFSPIYGILEEGHLWKRFFTSRGLEQHLERYTSTTYTHDFNFCILLCVRKDRTGFIEQLLTFPFVQKSFRGKLNDEVNFNLNILVLDSVSRPHFYRSLPKTVKSLGEIVNFASYNATVLDFELLQSSASYTFHNIRPLMSGRIDLNSFGRHGNETYGIDVLFGKFKRLGYYTLLQEDSCWYDSWGSLFTDNTYQGNVPRYKHEFAKRWKTFREKVKNYNIDDFGLSHASCEIFKRYNTTNQFNHPKKVCFDGKPFADYFLDYVENVYDNVKKFAKETRLLTYTHLNIGHEITGTRIRQIDERLSQYIEHMAKMENTLTILLSDHGPKTTKYSFHTMEGRAEKYDPFLFVVIPVKVALTLGQQKLHALAENQYRLITTLDIHNGFKSLGGPATTSTIKDKGIFDLIPANRTCAELALKPLAVCKCDGWETTFPDNDKRFTWLAEFALGTINNQIQKQFLKGNKQVGGYGNCQRLVGRSFSKIRRRSQGSHFVTTMDITVRPGREIFEVQMKYPRILKKQTSFLNLIVHERVTIYRHFRKCVDSTVSLGLCVCSRKAKKQKWVNIKNREDVFEIISRSNSFASQIRIKDIHQGCLLLMYRNHGGRSTSFEISNICNDRTYNATISFTDVNRNKYFVSRKVPFLIFVPQRTIHFLLVIKSFRKTSHNLRMKVKYAVQYL